jgi:hypothetical protein
MLRLAVETGDWESALALAQSILARDPADHEARAYVDRSRAELLSHYEARLGARDRVLRVTVPDDWLAQMAIDPRAAFLLSRIDGRSSIEEVLDMASSLPALDAMAILVDMMDDGVVEARPRPPTLHPRR